MYILGVSEPAQLAGDLLPSHLGFSGTCADVHWVGECHCSFRTHTCMPVSL